MLIGIPMQYCKKAKIKLIVPIFGRSAFAVKMLYTYKILPAFDIQICFWLMVNVVTSKTVARTTLNRFATLEIISSVNYCYPSIFCLHKKHIPAMNISIDGLS